MRWSISGSLASLAIAALLLSGCAANSQFIEGYDWVPDETGKHPCNFRQWVWVPEDQDEGGFWYSGKTEVIGYVMDHAPGDDCLVVAKVSESASHVVRLPYWVGTIMMPGETVWEHEERHWKAGLVHPLK